MSSLTSSTSAVLTDRLTPDYYLPPRIPWSVAKYAGVPDTLAAGSPGKVGLLDLSFAKAGDRTDLVAHYQKSPLQVMRPLYVDPLRPGTPFVYVMSTGGGILQSDRLRMDVSVSVGSSVFLTTQAATKVHRMDADYATQVINIEAGADSVVEYYPEPTIVFAGSRFFQRAVVTADPSATVLFADCFTAGRLARGERHAYDVYASDFELRNPAGDLLVADRIRLESDEVSGPGRFGDASIMASLFVVQAGFRAAELVDALTPHIGVRWGASALPADSGAWVRILGDDSPAVQKALRAVYDRARLVAIGVPAPNLRKG